MAVTNALAITIANVGEIYERMQKKTDFFIGKRYIYVLLSINVSFFKTKIRGKTAYGVLLKNSFNPSDYL